MARTTPLQIVCEHCGSTFESFEKRKRFCNHSCAATFLNRQRGNKPLIKAKPFLEKWLDGEWNGTTAKGLSNVVRRYLLIQADNKCSRCGWSGTNLVTGRTTLQIDHIDGNAYNNCKENLKVLCPNCHSLTPTWGNLNKGNGRKSQKYGG